MQPFSPGFDPNLPGGAAPRKSGCTTASILLIAVGVVLVVVCCGGLTLFFRFGMDVYSQEVAELLRDNPKLREHIGEIETFEVDLTRSASTPEDVFVFRVQGSKGEGTITAETITKANGDEEIRSASLRLPSGETVELVP